MSFDEPSPCNDKATKLRDENTPLDESGNGLNTTIDYFANEI